MIRTLRERLQKGIAMPKVAKILPPCIDNVAATPVSVGKGSNIKGSVGVKFGCHSRRWQSSSVPLLDIADVVSDGLKTSSSTGY